MGDNRWEDGSKIQCLLKRISKHRSKKVNEETSHVLQHIDLANPQSSKRLR
jgi:hypothetical protein